MPLSNCEAAAGLTRETLLRLVGGLTSKLSSHKSLSESSGFFLFLGFAGDFANCWALLPLALANTAVRLARFAGGWELSSSPANSPALSNSGACLFLEELPWIKEGCSLIIEVVDGKRRMKSHIRWMLCYFIS